MTSYKLSFEFFPPQSEQDVGKTLQTIETLQTFNPDFFSVTCGAGGSSKKGTQSLIDHLIQNEISNLSPHLTCISSSKEEIKSLLNDYQSHNIQQLLALRGDIPKEGNIHNEFKHANELIEFVRQETNDYFKIGIAAYPEFHPEAQNPSLDVENFKRKVDAGADFAITQYFFNLDSFFYFIEDCERLDIHIPIIPGIMPILNWEKIKYFSSMCQTEIPSWLYKRMESYKDDKKSQQQYGYEIITKMCQKLVAAGINHLHFYTLNMSKPVQKIIQEII